MRKKDEEKINFRWVVVWRRDRNKVGGGWEWDGLCTRQFAVYQNITS